MRDITDALEEEGLSLEELDEMDAESVIDAISEALASKPE